MTKRITFHLAAPALAAAVAFGTHASVAGFAEEAWVGTWATALHAPAAGPPGLTNSGFANQTLRQIVHTSIGGDRVRIRLSAFGSNGVEIGAARLALRDAGPAIVAGSDRALTFGGRPSVVIPAGAVVESDAVDLDVPPLSDLAVSLFVPGTTGPATWHFVAQQTSYVSPAGDFTTSVAMPVASTVQAWFWLAGVDVNVSKQTGAIAVLGDSVTDGVKSTVDGNMRWPDQLAERLMNVGGNHKMGVLNEGLTGNRLLHDIIGPNALARFDRDVLAHEALTHVIVFIGNNDIILSQFVPADAVTAEQIIQGQRLIIDRARTRGLAIYGATLTPLEGTLPAAVFPAFEAQRQIVNRWIRTSGEYDAVIDFDRVLRDPSAPARLLALFDSGDHLHPSDAGYAAMADAVDLELFKNGVRRQ
jgi:lysophospholipase L1-like esterase